MHTSTNVLGSLCLAMALIGCGGGYSGFIIPQETELKPWTEPSEGEILESAGIETVAEEGEEGDFEEYEDYADEAEGAEEATEEPTSSADPASTAKPEVKPAAKPADKAKK